MTPFHFLAATVVTSGSTTGASLGAQLPVWSIAPFALMLLAVAMLPLRAPHYWESNRNRALVAASLGLPVCLGVGFLQPALVWHTAWEYAAFMILLGSLYVIAGGIVVRGALVATPARNTAILLAGGVLASLIGTTGASMLLVRPLLRANAGRTRVAHVVVFFIFIVSNIGGLLSPLGDPPLFLGFLRGVPFFWTLRLWPQWAFATGALLLLFYVADRLAFRGQAALPGDRATTRLHLVGKHNVACLAALVGLIAVAGGMTLPAGVQELCMLALTGIAFAGTPERLRRENAFSWGPLVEVAIIFAGIFATMMPALALLDVHGGALGVTEPWQFFWLTGMLSSFLDNAPTYLTFTAAASSLLHVNGQALGELLATPHGEQLLVAISTGAVVMGANTYLGNGPNLMVKAVAEQAGVEMPGFFGYMAYSAAILLPLFGLMTWLFFG